MLVHNDLHDKSRKNGKGSRLKMRNIPCTIDSWYPRLASGCRPRGRTGGEHLPAGGRETFTRGRARACPDPGRPTRHTRRGGQYPGSFLVAGDGLVFTRGRHAAGGVPGRRRNSYVAGEIDVAGDDTGGKAGWMTRGDEAALLY